MYLPRGQTGFKEFLRSMESQICGGTGVDTLHIQNNSIINYFVNNGALRKINIRI